MTDSEKQNQNQNSRRAFLTGKAFRKRLEESGEAIADALTEATTPEQIPRGGRTIRLSTRAMACDFAVLLNADSPDPLWRVSDALDLVHPLEQQMTVYRADSELMEINHCAFSECVQVESRLFGLLQEAQQIARETDYGFDPTAGDLLQLWRSCKKTGRTPTEDEVALSLQKTGIESIELDADRETVRYLKPELALDLGGIGKGYALDRIGEELRETEVANWLIHGGHSSLLADGQHEDTGGWPVGIRNPLFPKEHLATILLQNRALSSSGSGVQFFRHQGKRYGHILDPRTGWPVENLLSVTVLAPTAALADALSTAFFVIGLENAGRYCDNHPEVSALFIPPPRQGRQLEPVCYNIPEGTLFFHAP